jgi:hypothetical protein
LTTAIAETITPPAAPVAAPAQTRTEKRAAVVPPARGASMTAVLTWVGTLASLATTGDPSGVEVSMTTSTIRIDLPGYAAYREWCAMTGVPYADLTTDELGTFARTDAELGGWFVLLNHHVDRCAPWPAP